MNLPDMWPLISLRTHEAWPCQTVPPDGTGHRETLQGGLCPHCAQHRGSARILGRTNLLGLG